MMHRIQAIAAAAALLLSGAALASPPETGSQGGHMEHCRAASSSLDSVLATLDQAATAGTAQQHLALAQARKQVGEAKDHMSHCMASMGELGGMAGMDHGTTGMNPGGQAAMNMGGMNMGGQKRTVPEVTDPVSGMKIANPKAAPRSVYAGKAYYFSSQEDKAKFDKDPEAYLQKKGT